MGKASKTTEPLPAQFLHELLAYLAKEYRGFNPSKIEHWEELKVTAMQTARDRGQPAGFLHARDIVCFHVLENSDLYPGRTVDHALKIWQEITTGPKGAVAAA